MSQAGAASASDLQAETTYLNAIQRARRGGRIAPPISVRRPRDGYLLLDGLFRLQAPQALGLERVAAVVEG